MNTTAKKRELWVDYTKAIACLSVLTFHVIYGLQNAGIQCDATLTVLKEFCGIFQIPMFMVASGYLFSKRPMGNYFKFQGRKLLNLGVPFVVFTSVYYFINSQAGSMVNFSSSTKQLWKCFLISPIAQYWYIFATILIFLLLPIVEIIFKNEWIILFVLLAWKIINWYEISLGYYDYYFAQYAFYFYLGVLYGRHNEVFTVKKDTYRTAIPLAMGMIALFASEYLYQWGMRGIVEMVISVITVYLLIYLFSNYENVLGNKFLQIIAKYSFQIYLMHTMVTAATRIVLAKIGVTQCWLQFVIGWIAGLSMTILVSFVCEKSIILNFVFFPEKTIQQLRGMFGKREN